MCVTLSGLITVPYFCRSFSTDVAAMDGCRAIIWDILIVGLLIQGEILKKIGIRFREIRSEREINIRYCFVPRLFDCINCCLIAVFNEFIINS